VLTSTQAVLAAAIGAPDPAVDVGDDDLAYSAAPALPDAIRDLDAREPSLRAATDVLRGQHELTRAIEAEHAPDVSVLAGLTGRAGGAPVAGKPTPTGGGWLPDVPNWNALVVMTWPVFDRTIDVRAEASRRIERLRAAEVDVERERLRGRLAQVYTDLTVAGAAVPALARALDAARANQAQADARFRSGLATAIELADAEALLTDAEIQLAVGQFQLARARARLARAIAERAP
jgi:outer membrane protein TolC